MNAVLVKRLQDRFHELFGTTGHSVFFAPGRVNLIGEHTDYNGGHVFPCALSVGTYGIISPRNDDRIRMYSENLPDIGIVDISLRELCPWRTHNWTQYPEGVFWELKNREFVFGHGANLMFAGDVPAGSGLSSSASLEVLTALMLRETYGFSTLTGRDLALVGQNAENAYCGMHCGIMDQFASAMGKAEHAIYLDTETLDYSLIPLRLGEYELLITNSKVKHSLVSSAYNDRRRECAEALSDLQKVPALAGLKHLCELTGAQFDNCQNEIKSPVNRKRAKHAVYENERTVKAVQALQNDDLTAFGRLMNDSHRSLRDDYEVSCKEIDFLVDETLKIEGVAGSRITGGGFGGCTVSIVRTDQAEKIISTVGENYRNQFGLEACFYRVMPEEGAHVIFM